MVTARLMQSLVALVFISASALGCTSDDSISTRAPSPEDAAADSGLDAAPDAQADGTTDSTGPAPSPDASERDAASPGGPFPIVLAHGMFGFEHLADLEGLDYYFRVEDALRSRGDVVLVKEVDPFNDSYVRGQQLLDHIETFLDDTEHARVNIIAHSQGGLDARYVAHRRPDLVASVLTISTPHRGTPIADIVVGLARNQLFRDAVDALVRLVGRPLFDEVGRKTSIFAPLDNFSAEGIDRFNQQITDQPGVLYASVAGRTANKLGEDVCSTPHAPSFISAWDEVPDPVDPLLAISEAIVSTNDDAIANDGLVRVADAKWGLFLGCVPADHIDEVGQLVGDDPGAENNWDHLQFYLDLVDWLRARGL